MEQKVGGRKDYEKKQKHEVSIAKVMFKKGISNAGFKSNSIETNNF